MKDVFVEKFKIYEKENCLGRIIKPENGPEHIYYQNYGEIFKLCHSIGSAIVNEKLFYQPDG